MVKSWIGNTWEAFRDDPDKLAQFEKDLLKVQRNLERRPTRFGEPVDDLPNLKLTRCIGFAGMLIVNYGVVRRHRLVVISLLRLRK